MNLLNHILNHTVTTNSLVTESLRVSLFKFQVNTSPFNGLAEKTSQMITTSLSSFPVRLSYIEHVGASYKWTEGKNKITQSDYHFYTHIIH